MPAGMHTKPRVAMRDKVNIKASYTNKDPVHSAEKQSRSIFQSYKKPLSHIVWILLITVQLRL